MIYGRLPRIFQFTFRTQDQCLLRLRNTSYKPISHFSRSLSSCSVCCSGHNKWSKIKHDKGKADAKKANTWSRISEEISEFTKRYGADPQVNPRLKLALEKAKKSGMTGASVDNAIKRGQGLSISGKPLETVLIEGMTYGGVSFIIECITDNKLRTLQDIRLLIKDSSGKLAPTQYLFVRQPFMHISAPDDISPKDQVKMLEDPILSVPIEYVGLLEGENSTWEARVEHSDPPLQVVEDMQKLLPEGWTITKTGLKFYASEKVLVEDDSEPGTQLKEFLVKLENENDVMEVYTNLRWQSWKVPEYEIQL